MAGQCRQAATQGQHISDFRAWLELINCAMVCGSHQGHAGARGGNHDHIARLQCGVFGFVALGNEFVKV